VIVEDLEFRVWAALRPIDAVTRLPVEVPLLVHGEGQVWKRNRSGLWVLHEVDMPAARRTEFAAYEDSFTAPTAVTPAVNVLVRIDDPGRRWLSRRMALSVPRAATAAPGVLPPLFSPIDVPLYSAPNAPMAAPWAVLRAHVGHAGAGAPGCAITVHEPGDGTRILGRGQSDARGEAVVAVPGVPVHLPSGGPSAFVRERAAQVTVVFEPGADSPPDTDALADATGPGFSRTTVGVVIASGRMTPLEVNLP